MNLLYFISDDFPQLGSYKKTGQIADPHVLSVFNCGGQCISIC